MDIDRYLPFLEHTLTPKRLEHSLGVMDVMGELAEVYSLDRAKALTVGLLHDAAKDLELARHKELVEEAGIEIRYPCEKDPLYLHAPVSAYLVYKELQVTDPLILDAISMHTYYGDGANFDAPICWCQRFADILEPTRDWRGVRWLRRGVDRLQEVVYAGRMEEGALLQTGWLIEWYEEKGTPVHPNMRRTCQKLSTKLDVDSTFFQELSLR